MDRERRIPARSGAVRLAIDRAVPVYAAAVFTSALLLFAVQPMFTRMVLPRLGGSPAVWSVAMVFFQSMLLAGYAYAHALMRASRPAVAVIGHLGLLVAAASTLPLAIAAGWGAPPAEGEAFWLLGLFTVSIGLPFFALSANNPLLQAWFVATGHREGADPYFLYAASNIGSFLALLSYPVLLEPLLSLHAQNLLWTGGFVLLIGLVGACGLLVLAGPPIAVVPALGAGEALSWQELGRWIVLSAVPSGLLVAVTAHISTDIAAVPLLWVVPLSLYLLTWVIVFRRGHPISPGWSLRLQALAVAGLAVLLVLPGDQVPLWATLAGHLTAFFLIAIACHGQLAASRPPARYLTTFYLSLSAGGMVGGLFAGLIAPNTFSWVAEYPILIVLAALCRPDRRSASRQSGWLLWSTTIIAALAVALLALAFGSSPLVSETILRAAAVMSALGALLVAADRAKFASLIAASLLAVYPLTVGGFETMRSFFGVHKVQETPDGKYRILLHGTTIHGAQQIRGPDGHLLTGPPKPLTYYHRDSPMAQAIRAVRSRKGGPIRVALVGLGTGSLACHRAADESWRVFEIDPDVVRIARDSGRFTFLSACAPGMPVVLGDARLTLAREPDGEFDLIVVDAFSSDSIPVHLMTREAMALYASKLAPSGVVMMHVSNRHLELASVVAGIAAANGMRTWVADEDEERPEEFILASTVAVVARQDADVGDLAHSEDWELTELHEGQRTWTDDYCNIVGALLRGLDSD